MKIPRSTTISNSLRVISETWGKQKLSYTPLLELDHVNTPSTAQSDHKDGLYSDGRMFKANFGNYKTSHTC